MKMISERPLWSILDDAGSDITAWLAMALTDAAPSLSMRSAAFVMVPAVSTISSTSSTSIPCTSPMIFISSTSFAFFLDL